MAWCCESLCPRASSSPEDCFFLSQTPVFPGREEPTLQWCRPLTSEPEQILTFSLVNNILRSELRSPHISEKLWVLQPPPSSAHRVSPNTDICFNGFDRGTFLVLPLTYLYLPKSARAYPFPQSVKVITFAAALLVLTLFVRDQVPARSGLLRKGPGAHQEVLRPLRRAAIRYTL